MITVINGEKRRRGRPPAFDRNEVLGRAAILFWQRGYEGTSISDLTEAMGITPQSLYAAFGSKAELYRDAVSWYLCTIGDSGWQDGADVVECFRTLLDGTAVTFTRPGFPPGCMISTAVLTAAVENVDIAAHMSRLRETNVGRFRDRLQRGIDDGQLRADTDTTALARFLGAIIQGMAVQARDGADTATLRDIAGMAMQQLEGARA